MSMDISHPLLLKALDTASPALASRATIPALQLFWFTGTALRATDGFIGIELPLETDFVGGVPGRVLSGFISSLKRKTVKITQADNSVVFSAGRSKITLPLNTTEGGVWQFDQAGEHLGEFSLSDEWREALAFAQVSVTNNTTDDERRGVTLAPEGKKLNLYATDGVTIAWASMAQPKGWQAPRATLPGDFVREILRVSGGTDTDSLRMYESMARAFLPDGVEINTMYLGVEDPTNFQVTIKRFSHNMEPIAIPKEFGPALQRAALLKDDKDGIVATLKLGEEGQFRIEASSQLGELKERIPHEGEHADIVFKIEPQLVLRALEKRETMIASKRCMTLVGPENFTYMVAASS